MAHKFISAHRRVPADWVAAGAAASLRGHFCRAERKLGVLEGDHAAGVLGFAA